MQIENRIDFTLRNGKSYPYSVRLNIRIAHLYESTNLIYHELLELRPQIKVMASVAQFYTSEHKGLSFELFPPKTERGCCSMSHHMEVLMQFSPDYITCTYGAGGSTQTKTMDVITAVKTAFDVPVASHLTCVGSTADDLRSYLEEASRNQVDFLVALRGDPPQGDSKFQPVEGGFSYANELVEFIRAEFPQFGMAVAGYPEVAGSVVRRNPTSRT